MGGELNSAFGGLCEAVILIPIIFLFIYTGIAVASCIMDAIEKRKKK